MSASKPFRNLPPVRRSSLSGLDPVGLLDAVMGSDRGDWHPPPPEILEPCFQGFDDFTYLDRGGMGAVYAARQISLDRRVAIKILPPELGEDEDFVARFHQEARLLAKLQHTHIVTIYDFGSTRAGHLFIVMEYVQGTSLLAMMKREPVGVIRSLEIACQVCEALQFAHERGVIHRDIKPTNILIDDRGHVRVADFGLAKLAGANLVDNTGTHTRAGKALGTPGYAAPEQRRAEPEVDPRADIFGLGVTLYEMLTGHLPVGVFESASRKVGSPAALDRVILRALQERPALRYQTAAQMNKALEPIAIKLGAPGFQRRLLQRPLTACVIAIQLLVTGWLLFDKLYREGAAAAVAAAPSFVESTVPIPLNDRYSLLAESMSWNRAREQWDNRQGYRLARITSASEQRGVAEALRERQTRMVWIGAQRPEGSSEFRWTDGSPLTFQAWMPAHTEPAVIITEIQAKNNGTLRDSTGGAPDWVELYNPGPETVDLQDWRFMERTPYGGAADSIRSHEGVSTLIAPNSYRLVLFGVPKADAKELSMPFNLESKRATLRWADPRGQVIQIFNRPWPPFQPDTSIGCATNGTDWGVCEAPTPGQPNRRRVTSIQAPDHTGDTIMSVLMEVESGGGWTMEIPQRKAWILLEKIP